MSNAELIAKLIESGDIPNAAMGNEVQMIADLSEDTPEAVSEAMELFGLDGGVAFDMAIED